MKDSDVVELVDEQIRRKDDPERWPIPGLPANSSHTDFSQLIHCPEFIPGQTFTSLAAGTELCWRSTGATSTSDYLCSCIYVYRNYIFLNWNIIIVK